MAKDIEGVRYTEKGEITFFLTEQEKEFVETELSFQNYQNPKIEVTKVYVTSEDRFYVKLVKTNIKGEVDTVFLTREEATDNKNHMLIAEKFGAYGIGTDEQRLRLASNFVKVNYDDCPLDIQENFGEIHYTYAKIGFELQKIAESLKDSEVDETGDMYIHNGLLLIRMGKIKAYVKKWGKSPREFKDYMSMLGVVEVSAGEERNCRYRHKSDSPWYMAFQIDKLKDIK